MSSEVPACLHADSLPFIDNEFKAEYQPEHQQTCFKLYCGMVRLTVYTLDLFIDMR